MLFLLSHFDPGELNHLHNASFERKLGEGSYGQVKVYRCKEKNCNSVLCNECFVVKTIKPFNLKIRIKYLFKKPWGYLSLIKSKLKESLLNEWEIGKNLNHPNIIKTLDIDLKRTSLILEYFESIDLFHYITKYNFPIIQKNKYSINIFKQILDGVIYLHEQSVAHLDLKLENIIINLESKKIKIIDFGKAKKINKKLINVDLCELGTLSYLPPEYFNKNIKYIDLIKIDTWACGTIFYNLIYNSSPWKHSNIKDIRFYDFHINGLSKRIFQDLSYRGWKATDSPIINKLFLGLFTENFEMRITLDKVQEILNDILFD